jgi:CO dehydrogenase/acetyl-CoA synthase beta subunit
MNPFDPYFARIREYTDGLGRERRSVRIWPSRPVPEARASAIGPSANIILKDETALELGGPRTASSAFMLWTDDASLVSDGTITLVGPDVPEVPSSPTPFGQVVLLGGPTLGSRAQPELERALHAAERAPGYMVRRTGGQVWARLSRDAAKAGFTFQLLGSRILTDLRDATGVNAAEILFVTSGEDDVRVLERIGAQVRKLAHDLRRDRLRETADGALECETEISCDACPDSDVCTDIREMIVIRKRGGRSYGPEP